VGTLKVKFGAEHALQPPGKEEPAAEFAGVRRLGTTLAKNVFHVDL